MKFAQLTEYKKRTIFLKKHSKNIVEKLFQDPYLKEQNSAYLWINSQKFHAVCFYCTQSGGLSNYIKTKLQTTC